MRQPSTQTDACDGTHVQGKLQDIRFEISAPNSMFHIGYKSAKFELVLTQCTSQVYGKACGFYLIYVNSARI